MSDDEVVNAAFLRVLNMIDPPQALFHPRVALRALRPARRTSDERPAFLGQPRAWGEALTG